MTVFNYSRAQWIALSDQKPSTAWGLHAALTNMISFGWSVGDVVSVCVILTHVIKAFDNAKGTQKHYRDSHAFLCGLFLVVSYVSDDEKAASLPEDAKTQIQSISNAYSDLHAYILKFAKIDKPDKTRLQSVLPTIKWTMNELNDKVQKMKTNSLSAISIMETLIVMDLRYAMRLGRVHVSLLTLLLARE